MNSEVCDITSTIKFLEKFLSKKTGRKIEESNISSWRRAVSGDLTSAFRPYDGEKIALPKWLDRNEHMQEIYNARFKALPNNFEALSADKARALAKDPGSNVLPKQEPGAKPSNALKYELQVDGMLSDDGKEYIIRFKAGKDIFGDNALGAPFNVYAPGNFRNATTQVFEPVKTWAFAVRVGDAFEYRWPLSDFEGGAYHLRVYGPNGFFREFIGSKDNRVEVTCEPVRKGRKITRQLRVKVKNLGKETLQLELTEDKYQNKKEEFVLKGGATEGLVVDTESVQGWYSFSLREKGEGGLSIQYAGRLETGADSVSDPYMGGAHR